VKAPAVQLLANAALFASLIFIPNYAKDALGADAFQVGVIVGTYSFFVFLSSYAFGRLADVRGRLWALRLGLVASAAAALTQIVAFDPWSLALSRALVGLAVGMFPAALFAYAYDARRPLGKFTSFGSLGWGLGSLLAGVLAAFWQIFAASALLFFVAFAVALRLPALRVTPLRVPLFPVAVVRRNLPIYLGMLLRHTGANAIWVIFPLFLAEVLGLPFWQIGALYATNAGTQFLVMRALDRVKSTALVGVGLLASLLTFLAFTVAVDFPSMFVAQVMLGTSWATLYVGSLKFVMERNVERATSAGLLQSTMSIAAIVGPFAGGALVEAAFRAGWAAEAAYETTMYVAAVLAAAAFVAFLAALRRPPSPQPVAAVPSPRPDVGSGARGPVVEGRAR
jgi:MFS family permease